MLLVSFSHTKKNLSVSEMRASVHYHLSAYSWRRELERESGMRDE